MCWKNWRDSRLSTSHKPSQKPAESTVVRSGDILTARIRPLYVSIVEMGAPLLTSQSISWPRSSPLTATEESALNLTLFTPSECPSKMRFGRPDCMFHTITFWSSELVAAVLPSRLISTERTHCVCPIEEFGCKLGDPAEAAPFNSH